MEERCRVLVFSLDGKVSIVTGGGRGIGQAIAVGLAQVGSKVVVVSRTVSELEETCGRVREEGRDALAVVADVSRREDVHNVVATTLDKFERVDVLINNAGITPPASAPEDLPPHEWERTLAINLSGAWWFCQEVGRASMIPRRQGKIVNITSIDAYRPWPTILHYNVSKAGLTMLTKALRWNGPSTTYRSTPWGRA